MDMQRANDLGFFKGLSDQFPDVIERFLKEVFEYVEFFTNAICISGWEGIGNERILKYVAKRVLVESKVDVLVWVVGRNKESSIRNFQLQIADRLGILNPKDGERDDDEDEQTVDEAVSTKDCKFLLVHNGDWNLSDLWQMGIPNIKNSSSMIFVSSSAALKYHQYVRLNSLSDKEVHDLLQEECLDIYDHLTISSPSLHITPDVVMECILYLLLFDINIRIETLVWYWYAEGFIGTPTMDLDAIFKCGRNLLDDLQYRHMVSLRDDHIVVRESDDARRNKLLIMLCSGITLFPRKFKGFLDFGHMIIGDIRVWTLNLCLLEFGHNF